MRHRGQHGAVGPARSVRRCAAAVLAGLALAALTAAPAGAAVYWADAWSAGIGRANLDGTGADPNLVLAQGAFGVAVDAQHLYWNAQNVGVARSALNGSDVEPSFIASGASDRGVAVDGAHVYWALYGGSTAGRIGRADLDGSNVQPDFIVDQAGPCGIAVDGAHIYWGNVNSGTIGRANLDGSAVDPDWITLTGGAPCGVAVNGSYVYWAEHSSIGRAGLDGSGVNESFITGPIYPCGVAVDDAHVYWAGQQGFGLPTPAIGRANLDGSAVEQQFVTASGIDRPCGIAVDALKRADLAIARTHEELTFGEPFAMLASVTGDSPAPTGAVTFTRSGDDPLDVPLDEDGDALYVPDTLLNVGDTIAVDYPGDAEHVSQRVRHAEPVVKPAPTDIQIAVSPNPVVSGGRVRVSVTVRNTRTEIPPFGSVDLYFPRLGAIGVFPLDADGKVTVELELSAPAGAYTLAANYWDDTVDFPPLADFVPSNAFVTVNITAPPSPTAPWSTPGAVQGATGSALFAFGSGGNGLALFPRATGGARRAGLGPNGAFQGATALSGIVPAQMAADGGGQVLVTGTSAGSAPRATTARGPATGALGAARPLGSMPRSSPIALATDGRGAAAAVVRSPGRLELLLRRTARASFGRPIVLARGTGLGAATAALDASGRLLVAWEQQGVVYARTGTARGTLGERRRLGPGVDAQLSGAVETTGRATVLWSSQRTHAGAALSPATIAYASAAAGRPFGSRHVVESVPLTGAGRALARPAVEVAAVPGRTVVAWTGARDGRFAAKTADLTGGRLGTPQVLSPATGDAVLGDLAVGPRGGAAVAWLAGIAGRVPSAVADPTAGIPAGRQRLYVSTRAPSAAAFGTPEPVSPVQRIGTAPRVAVDPASGRVVALWDPLGHPSAFATRTTIEPAATAARVRARLVPGSAPRAARDTRREVP